MSSAYTLHRDLSTPTAVDHTVTAHFTAADDTNLILIKHSILELHTLTLPDSRTAETERPQQLQQHQYLQRVGHYVLCGVAASIIVVRLPGYSRDSLLLSFPDCKLSLLHFSPSTLELYTLDTAYLDSMREQLAAAGHPSLTPSLPLLRCDPLQRCVVLAAHNHHFLVFPLDAAATASSSLPSEQADFAQHPYTYTGPSGILRPFSVPFSHPALSPPREPAAGLTCMVDFCFLSGYNSPTLLILHRHPYTWEGRYAAHRHTAQLLTITLDLANSSFLLLARTALTLPYDTHALLPLPAPHAGCLVVSSHLLFHFSNQHIDFSLSTNVFGDTDGKFHPQQSGAAVGMQLAAAAVLPFNHQSSPVMHVLLGMRDGVLLLVTLETAGTGVRGMQLRKLASSAVSSGISVLERRGRSIFAFFGSRVGSSVLVELRERSEKEMQDEAREQERQEDERNREREEREKERQRLLHGGDGTDEVAALPSVSSSAPQTAEGEDELFDDIFGLSLSSNREREQQRRAERARAKEETSRLFELTVRDAMIGLAPCVDFVMLPATQPEADEEKEGRRSSSRLLDIVGISGQGQQGAISIQNQGIHPLEITGFALDQRCSGCWTVRAQERRVKRSQKRRRDEAAAEASLSSSSPPLFDTDLFISGPSSTTHLHTGDEITQVESAASYLRVDVQSLLVANVCGWLGVVQVWEDGVRLVWRGEKVVERSCAQLLHDGDDEEQLKDERKDSEDADMVDERKERTEEELQDNGVASPGRSARGAQRPPVKLLRAKACDPYLALCSRDGRLFLLRVDEVERKEEHWPDSSGSSEPFTISLIPTALPPLPAAGTDDQPDASASAVTAFHLYREQTVSGLFSPLSLTTSSSSSLAANGSVADAESDMQDDVLAAKREEKAMPPSVSAAAPAAAEEMDELEMLLGGGGADRADEEMKTAPKTEASAVKQEAADAGQQLSASVVCVVCRSHYLELFSLPSFSLIFRCPRFAAGRKSIVHSDTAAVTAGDDGQYALPTAKLPSITDVCLQRISPAADALPVLLAYSSLHDLLIYQAFSFPTSQPPLRFSRFQHPFITRLPLAKPGRLHPSAASASASRWLYGDRFVSFPSLSGHFCVLAAGYRPLLVLAVRGSLRVHDWLLDVDDTTDEADKETETELNAGALQLLNSEERSSRLRAGLACATPFHNSQCERGCVFIDIAGRVHIAELLPPAPLPAFAAQSAAAIPSLLTADSLSYAHYEHSLPVRLHPVNATPRFLSFHPPTGSFAVVLSRPKTIQSVEEQTSRSLVLSEEAYELLLLSPPSSLSSSSSSPFAVIGRFDDFDSHEVVLCLTVVTLGAKVYLAIGTATQAGEETSVRGRVLLLDAYAAASSSSSAPLLKLRVFAQAEKGPVTAIGQVGGLLVVGVGTRLMLYEYDSSALIGRAFLDVPHYVVSVSVVKYYIAIADCFHALLFVAWDPLVRQLTVLGRHSDGVELTAVALMVEQRQLSVVAADIAGNLSVLRWQPKSLPPPPPAPSAITSISSVPLSHFFAAVYSQRMSVKGDFHTGSAVTRMESWRLRGREARKPLTARGGGIEAGVAVKGGTGIIPEPVTAKQQEVQQLQPFKLDTNTPPLASPSSLPPVLAAVRSALLLSSQHGQYALLQPLDELVYRRLQSLCSQLQLQVPLPAALNAKGWRSVEHRGGRYVSRRGVVDGALLWQLFLGLELDTQTRLSSTIGMQAEHLIDIMLMLEGQAALR